MRKAGLHVDVSALFITPTLAALTRFVLPDGSSATVEYAGSTQVDTEQRMGIFRRDIKLSIEYATVATRTDTAVGIVQVRPAMVVNSFPVSLPATNY